MQFEIDPDFKCLIPPLSSEERAQLARNIEEGGCREPLAVWKNGESRVLLDGHNRFEICRELGIDYQVLTIELSSKREAKNWIIRN